MVRRLEKASSLGVYNGVYLCTKPKIAQQIRELESRLILPPLVRPKKVEEKLIDLYCGIANVNERYGGVYGLPKVCPGFIYDYTEGVNERTEIVRDEETIAYRKNLIDRHLRESFIKREDGLYDCILGEGKGLGQLVCNITGFTAMREPQDFDRVMSELIKQGKFSKYQVEISLSGEFGATETLEITKAQRQTIIDFLASTKYLAISERTLNEFYYHLPATDATVQYELNKLLQN